MVSRKHPFHIVFLGWGGGFFLMNRGWGMGGGGAVSPTGVLYLCVWNTDVHTGERGVPCDMRLIFFKKKESPGSFSPIVIM